MTSFDFCHFCIRSLVHFLLDLRADTFEWPGNVRELENLMQRTVLLTKGPIVTEFYGRKEQMKVLSPDKKLKSITQNEKDHIIAALKSGNWKVYGPGGAAEILDMNVSTLNSRIKKLGIEKARITRNTGNITKE